MRDPMARSVPTALPAPSRPCRRHDTPYFAR